MNKELLNENLNLIMEGLKNNCRDDGFAFSVFMLLISLIAFICSVIRLIFAYTSPKLYIIHYIKDLIQ